MYPRPHGNKKANNNSNKSYIRAKKSTLDKIKKELISNEPKKIVHSVIEDLGGIEKVRSGSDIPRNRKQVYNAVQSISRPGRISDPLAFLMQKCKEEFQDEKTALIRSVQVIPEPIIFLATQQQLRDVERFCTNPKMFCVLGVDATFELCDYYMTFASYRNPMLQSRKRNAPVIVGPGILHKTKLERSYQAQEFDDAVTKLKPVWEERHSKGAEFVKYFIEKRASDIKETMAVEIRSLCGLGFPPDVYTQNANESMNRVLKEEDQHATLLNDFGVSLKDKDRNNSCQLCRKENTQ